MIYIDKLQTKLDAILAKDLDDIIAKDPYIPFLGKNYNKNSLQNWLQKRIDVLVELRDGGYTEQQMQKFVDFHYGKLNAADKLVADKILNGEEYSVANEAQWENVVMFILYRFVTTP